MNIETIQKLKECTANGFASQGLGLVNDAFACCETCPAIDLLYAAISVGAFSKVQEAVDRAPSLLSNDVIRKACRAAYVLEEQLIVSESKFAILLDAAGDIMRSNQLGWTGDCPDLIVLDADSDGSALIFEYRLDVSSAKAAEMSWSLTEALVERELDVPGVSIGFIGTVI